MKGIKLLLASLFLAVALVLVNHNVIREPNMGQAKYTLSSYNGVGSTVFKHGTIVKIDADGNVVPVGSFTDDTGVEYPGTVQIEEVK